jgi:hypothetical protein
LNCHNVAKHCKFDERGTVVPNTVTVIAPAVEIKVANFTGVERARSLALQNVGETTRFYNLM